MFRENIDAIGFFGIIFSVKLPFDGSTENDPDEKPSREKMLVNAFIELASKLHAMFVQS